MAFEEQTLDITVTGDILPQVSVQLNGKPVVFIVDTGAICSIISRKQMKLLGFCESDLSNTEFFSGNELGELDIDVKINDLEMKALFVVSDCRENLLALDFLATYCCKIDLINMKLTFR